MEGGGLLKNVDSSIEENNEKRCENISNWIFK